MSLLKETLIGTDRQNKAMDRYLIIIMMALVSFACTKEDTGADIDTSGYTLFEVSMDELLLDPDSPQSLYWKEGDRIGVYGSESGTNAGFWLKESGEGKSVAEFYGPLVKGSIITAYYPWSSTYDATVGRMPVDLSSVQVYDPQATAESQFLKYATMAFARMDAAGVLDFSYPFGMIRVTVTLDEPVYITAAGLRSSDGIAGRLEVVTGESVVPVDVSESGITLDFQGQEVPSVSGTGDAGFLFVVPAASYEKGSLEVSLSLKGGEEIIVSLDATDVPKVSASDFQVADVVVGVSSIPALDIENGYLE